MAWTAPVGFQVRVQHSGGTGWMDLYDNQGRPVTVWKDSGENVSNMLVSTWSNPGGTWGVLNGKAYNADDIITAKDMNVAVSGDIADSFERVDEAKRFDDFLVAPNAPEPESDTPLVPTDVQVPDNFQVQEYLRVRIHFDRFGDFEDDTELWSTPAGAQGRIRQILFTRDDVISCEAVTVWKREKA